MQSCPGLSVCFPPIVATSILTWLFQFPPKEACFALLEAVSRTLVSIALMFY